MASAGASGAFVLGFLPFDAGDRVVVPSPGFGISYGNPATTALTHAPSALVVQSFSKYSSMTGWRLGWVIAPEDLATPIERLGQNLAISAPTLSQVAACAAFDCHDELRANVARYGHNRQILLDGLPDAKEIEEAIRRLQSWV